MAKAAPQIVLTPEQVTALAAWEKAKKELDDAKTAELLARMEAIRLVPFDAEKTEGSQSLKLGGGWTLKLDRPMNYSVDKDANAVTNCLAMLHCANQNATEGLIRWQAEISTVAYKKLTDDERKIIAPVVTIKPGQPALTLTPPAPKKD